MREILPTSLPELPRQLRDLRNNEKSILLEPVLGRKVHLDFESGLRTTKVLQPDGTTTRTMKTIKFKKVKHT